MRQAYDTVKACGSIVAAAAHLELPRTTLQSRFVAALEHFKLPDPRGKPIDHPGFTAYQGPSKERPLDEILAHRRNEAMRSIESDEFTRLFRIKIKASGPIGLMIFGDPHIDSPGCDFPLLEQHLKIA